MTGIVVPLFPEPAPAIERLSDGRRKGNHGNRTPRQIKAAIVARLLSSADDHEPLAAQVVLECAELANTTPRTIQRWRKHALQGRARQRQNQPQPTDGPAEMYATARLAQGDRPMWLPDSNLLRGVEHYPTMNAAWKALHADPGSPVSEISRSTFYKGFAAVHPAVRAGEAAGPAAMRAHSQIVPPLRELTLNEMWSVDLYTIKVALDADDAAGVEDGDYLELVMVREVLTNTPIAERMFTYVPTADDVAALIGEAIIGWTWTDPHGVEQQVSGAAQYLRCDQGVQFMAAALRHKLAYVGMVVDPTHYRWPDGNGGHERFHLDLGRYLDTVPGATGGPKDRSGRSYDWRVRARTADVRDAVRRIIAETRFEHRPRTQRHQGRTPMEMYTDLATNGAKYLVNLADEAIAELALPRATREMTERQGFGYRNHRYLGLALSRWGRDCTVVLSSLNLDDGVTADDALYIHEEVDGGRGRFIGVVWRDDKLPQAEVQAILALRDQRRNIVETDQARRATARATGRVPDALPADIHPAPAARPASLEQPPGGTVDGTQLLQADPTVQAVLADPVLLQALRELTPEEIAALTAAPAEQTPVGAVDDEQHGNDEPEADGDQLDPYAARLRARRERRRNR